MKFILGDESMYELITQNEADRIKDILRKTGLKKNIKIEVLEGKYKIKTFDITESYKSERHRYGMDEFYLIDNNGKCDVLEYKNKLYEVFISFGEWDIKLD